MTVNEEWHRTHPMPKHPSLRERIAWHRDHAEQCGCREMPSAIRKEIARQGKAKKRT